MATKNTHYAYLMPSGEKGILTSWEKCKEKVQGIKGSRYKGFKNREEAELWLSSGALYDIKTKMPAKKGIYFDAGTGRGEGVEVSVTNEKGEDLLSQIVPKELINKHDKHLLPKGKTNNYGELLACLFAIQIAKKKKINKIFGDSKLVIDYWSKGHIKKDINKDTIELAYSVRDERKKFEEKGGEIIHISGDENPADLGFHR